MALLFVDSFDHYATGDLLMKWSASGTSGGSATVTIGSANGRHGSNGLRLGTGGGSGSAAWVQKTLAPADANVLMGFAVMVPAGTVGTLGMALAAVFDGSTTQVTLRLNPDYTLTVLRGIVNGTVLGSPTSVTLAAGVMAYVEWKVLIHPTAGTVAVRVNGATVLNLTNQNTRASAASQWTSVIVGSFDIISGTITGSGNAFHYDDLYVLDGSGTACNSFLGDVRVDYHLPNANGTNNMSTPSLGTERYATVDDVTPNGDVDYNTLIAVGDKDTYNIEALKATGAAILGLQVIADAKKTDAGIASMCPVLRHAGSDYDGTAVILGTAYSLIQQIYMTNPGTGLQFVEADFNALEVGVKRIS